MSLIVAGKENGAVWMVGDTAITAGTVDLRAREYMPKILVGTRHPSMVAFAGGPEHGLRVAEQCITVDTPDEAIRLLAAESADTAVDFLYAAVIDGQPSLYIVSNGATAKRSAAHIGDEEWFEAFQRVRHQEDSHGPPETLKLFMSASKSELEPPSALRDATRTMIDVFGLVAILRG